MLCVHVYIYVVLLTCVLSYTVHCVHVCIVFVHVCALLYTLHCELCAHVCRSTHPAVLPIRWGVWSHLLDIDAVADSREVGVVVPEFLHQAASKHGRIRVPKCALCPSPHHPTSP